MGRFEWLELPSEGGKPKKAQGPRIYDADQYAELAEERYWNGDYEGALRYYSRVLNLQAANLAAWLGQVRALIELGEFPEAVLWSDKALERFPDDAELTMAKAIANHRMGNAIEAKRLCDAAIRSPNKSPILWLGRGEIFLADHPKNAEYCMMKATEGAANEWRIWAMAGRIYLVAGHFRQATDALKKAVAINSRLALVWGWLGEAYQELSMVEQAKQSYREALRIRPGYELAKKELYRCDHQGMFTRLSRWLRRTILRRKR